MLTATRSQAPDFLAVADFGEGSASILIGQWKSRGQELRAFAMAREKRNALSRSTQLLVEWCQAHGDNSRSAKNGHVIMISLPSRNNMQVKMIGDTGPGSGATFHPTLNP